jgi:hypothetical protein
VTADRRRDVVTPGAVGSRRPKKADLGPVFR